MHLLSTAFISDKEEARLFKAMDPFVKAGDGRALIEYVLFQTLRRSGLRISEALALTWDHLDLEAGFLQVYSKDAKNSRSRSVTMSNKLIEILRDFKARNPYSHSRFLFNTQKGQMRRTTAHDRLKYWLAVAGLRDSISCHSFRHSYATHMIECGIPLATIQRQLGHCNISITSTYLHVTQSAVDRLREIV